ncbi:MAG: EAL domain-containing protein [Pseudomonadota bacterium]|nr:EAL domain-containing protein [Pseudomonadota bacterium]
MKRDEYRITFIGFLILMLLTCVAGLSVYVVMQHQVKSILSQSLEVSLKNRIQIFDNQILQGMAQTQRIAARPALINSLVRLRSIPGNPGKGTQNQLQQFARSFLTQEYQGVSILNSRGKELAHAGYFLQKPEFHVALDAHPGAALLWDGQFVLQAHSNILDNQGQRIGQVTTQKVLGLLTRDFTELTPIGKTGEFALCAPLENGSKDMDCLLSGSSGRKVRQLPRVIANQGLPMNYALDGKTGIVSARDYRRRKVVAAFAPVGRYGLGMVLKVDEAELYHPVTAQLESIAFLLMILLVIGGLLLYWLVMPLVRKLVNSRRELSETGARLQAILDNAPAGIWLIGVDGRFRFMNRTLCNAIGVKEEGILGTGQPEELLSPHGVAQQGERHPGQESPYTYCQSLAYADGHRHLLEITQVRLCDDTGKILGTLGISIDITERQRVETALKRECEKNRTFLRNASDGIHILDRHGKIIEASEAFCAMLGYRHDEMIGMKVSQWEANFNEAEIAEILRKLFEQQERFQFETRQRRKDGTVFDVEVSCSPLKLDDEVLFFAASRDITGRKKIENELRIAAIAFESQEGILVTDAHSVILKVNPAFTAITGYTPAEAIGQTPRILRSGRQDADFYARMWKSIHTLGKWEGEIWNRRRNGEIYPEYLTITAVRDPDGNVTNYVAILSDITLRKESEEKIRYLAFYDPLTALPNRRLLHDRLQQAMASSARCNQKGALLFIDLDNFKALNDTLGHAMGDMYLQQVAKRLATCLRESDSVARFGGDEFVVMLENLSQHDFEAARQTEAVAAKIFAVLGEPYQLEMHEYRSSSSIGAVLFSGTDLKANDLFKQADIAMYQAKKSGHDELRFFDQQMQERIDARVKLEDELYKAIEKKQFQLYYQIQVDHSNRPLGAEALIRWMHPVRGLVAPCEFIPLAEETGLILPLGMWVLETACARIKVWEQNDLTRNLALSVNVSARQFHQSSFVAQIQSLVQRYAINPALLKLELTESMLLDNTEHIILTMNALGKTGVQFSLDDFGTGYSSLQYLKRLPLHQLKIDKSFVDDIATDSSDMAIVTTIIAMARSLNLQVIAEGVETDGQRQILLKQGCENFQGYLFSKPVPIELFEVLLQEMQGLSV